MEPSEISRSGISDKSTFQAVHRAAQALACFTPDEPSQSVTSISKRLGIHKSTTSRLLATLEEEGFVRRDPSSRSYVLGYRLLELATVLLDGIELREVARPYLTDIWVKSQETVNMAVLDGDTVLNVDLLPSPQPIQYVGVVGRRTPFHCTATGKILLATEGADFFERVVAQGLDQYTRQTIVAVDRLKEEIASTRQRGFSIVKDEFQEGVTAVAAPILNGSGKGIAAISVAGPSNRLSDLEIERYGKMLIEAAVKISRLVPFTRPNVVGGNYAG